MGTTRTALEKRIEQLAQRLGVCSHHGCQLKCVCQFQWDGSDEELFEANALAEKMTPGMAGLQFTGLACKLCGSLLWCRQCIEPSMAPDAKALLTPAEQQRYLELTAMMHEKPPPLSFAEFMRQPSTDALAPELPAPQPPPEPPAVVEPVVAPEPEIQPDNISLNTPKVIDDDDDEEADPNLVSLVTELMRQIGGSS